MNIIKDFVAVGQNRLLNHGAQFDFKSNSHQYLALKGSGSCGFDVRRFCAYWVKSLIVNYSVQFGLKIESYKYWLEKMLGYKNLSLQ